MRKWLSSFAVGSLALLSAAHAEAFCGFYVSGADAKLYNNATQVVLLRDGTRTVLSMQNNYQGPPEGFAMVVPVPVVLQKENVKTLDRAVFDRVDQLTAPRLVQYWEQDPCYVPEDDFDLGSAKMAAAPQAMQEQAVASGGQPLVRIEAQFAVGEYEIVILSADDSSALEKWLLGNGYKIPDGAEPVLRPYVASGSKFFVAKVDATKVKFEKGMATLSPLRFHYDDEAFRLPIRLGLLSSKGTQDLIVNIIARQTQYEVANYPNVPIPTNIELNEEALSSFGAFYVALFDKTVAKTPKAVVTEYAWSAGSCDPCPGPTLQLGDIATLGGDTLLSARDTDRPPGSPPRSGLQPWDTTITRLHARYTKDSLGEDLVFRKAPAMTGGNGWMTGPDKHGATTSPHGSPMFQGRYIVRHPWKGEITCPNPQFGRWGGAPSKVEPAKDLAFAPREGVTLASLVAEDVPLLGLKGTPPNIERRYNVSIVTTIKAYFGSASVALLMGALLGSVAAFLVSRKVRRAS